MAALLMSSHHGFRRDVACLGEALASNTAPRDLLRAEWNHLRTSLHHHHTVEDTGIFPNLRAEHGELAAALAELEAHHRQIDPLLERGDAVFDADPVAARAVIAAIADLLTTHLELEERTITPHLRGNKEFPAPPDEQALAYYADGFAWSTAGLAPQVTEQIFAMLPAALRDRIPAARAQFDERCRRVWGRAHADVSTTSAP